jgi:hypothetical protein
VGGHTLWTRDEWTYRAFNAVLRHRGHPTRGQPRWPSYGDRYQYYGRTILIARPKKMYGRATGRGVTDRTVTHCTRLVGLAFMRGTYRGSMMLWMCGGLSTEFDMADEVQSRWCPTCWLRFHGISHGDGAYADTLRRITLLDIQSDT